MGIGQLKTVFYIGHQKTGSTSLQHFFARNTRQFLQNGILYPQVEAVGHASVIQQLLQPQDNAANIPIVVREPHSALAQKLRAEALDDWNVPSYFRPLPQSLHLLRTIACQARALRPDYLVLASEVFCSLGQLAPHQIKRLHECTDKTGETHIYFCLRRPDDYAAAWHGQRLRFDPPAPEPLRGAGFDHYLTSFRLRYALMIERWMENFPNARFSVRCFDDVKNAGGTIHDFFRETGLKIPDGAVFEEARNTSIPYAMREIARLAKNSIPVAQFDKFLDSLTEVCSLLPNLPKNDSIEMLGPRNRERLVEFFEPIHNRVGKLTGKIPFFEEIDDMARVRPVAELSAANTTLELMDRSLIEQHFGEEAKSVLFRLKKTGIRENDQRT